MQILFRSFFGEYENKLICFRYFLVFNAILTQFLTRKQKNQVAYQLALKQTSK